MNTFDDDDNTIESNKSYIITQEPVPKPAPTVDIETALNDAVNNVKSQLADSKKIAEKLTEQTIVFDKFGRQADNFFTKLNEELRSGIDRNFAQFGKEIDSSFKESFKENIRAGIAEIKNINDKNVQTLTDRAVKENHYQFYIASIYGLLCGSIGSLSTFALITKNTKYLWSIPVVFAITIATDYWINRNK
jgi:hypothetical protein